MPTETRAARHRGAAKTWLVLGMIVFLAVIVTGGLYFASTFLFGNGSTGTNLSAPNTGQATSAQPAATTNPTTPVVPIVPPDESIATGKVLDLTVVDGQTTQPLADMRVQNTLPNKFVGTTDANGRVAVLVPVDLANNPNFSIKVTGKGYVPKGLAWIQWDPLLRGTDMPASATLAMERPTRVRGTIVDDAGQGVSGASILIRFTKRYAFSHERVDLNTATMNRPLFSGSDGVFTYANAPANCDMIELSGWDYDHVSDDTLDPQSFTPVASLYDGTAKYVLNRGVKLSGTVVDTDGKPVARATVTRGAWPRQYFVVPPQKTDSSGRFSFHYSPGQSVILTFQARGFAPQMKRLTMGSDPQDLHVAMGKAHRISGRVVDADGRPVADARIDVESWEGASTLVADFKSDTAGMFYWNDAPADTVDASVSVPGAGQSIMQTLVPDQENVIHVPGVSHIHGTVMDARTGQPITTFTLMLGIQWPGNDRVTWQNGWNPGWEIRPGEFSIQSSWNYPAVQIRATALGYLPEDSRIIRSTEKDVNVELKLQPGKDLTFTVLDSNGNAVSDAQAVIALPGQQAQVFNGQVSSLMQSRSGLDGKMEFPPQAGAFRIAVTASEGFAEFDSDDLARSDNIRLGRWAVIKGRMMKGSKPAANEYVEMNRMDTIVFNSDAPRIFFSYSIKTDADGNFQADRIAPGKWTIARRVMQTSYNWSLVTLGSADAAAGQTLAVNLGGSGREVVGKLIYPPQLAGRVTGQFDSCQVQTRDGAWFESPPIPREIRLGSQQVRQKWFLEWSKTEEGKKFIARMQNRQAERRSYPLEISSDGSFRVEDVPAGDYSININLNTLSNADREVQPVAIGYAEFTMPPIEAAQVDEPLSVGSVQITPLGPYKAGDTVYDLALHTSDKKEVKFSDYQGKYLLLDISESSVRGNAPMKAVGAEYEGDSRLAFLTILPEMFGMGHAPSKISGNPGADAAIGPNGEGWTILSRNFSGGVWLIGPDGKVIAAGLKGDEIRAAVALALGAPRISSAAVRATEGLTTQPGTAP